MGQHFLTSDSILADIADAASLTGSDVVVEVGPGMGALTAVLSERAGRVLAVELDANLVAKLGEILSPRRNVQIVQSDILELNLAQAMQAAGLPLAPYKVVANLPYYITTPVLRYFFDQPSPPTCIVVTVQAEVARRMVAAPPDMNFLAVLVQFYGRPELVRLVPPAAFYPPPKVGSAVVRIVMRDQPLLDADRTRMFVRLLSTGFGQPRKQLHNPLMQGTGRGRAEVIAALHASGIDEKRRAETLSLAEWLALFNFLFPV
jgi:16S rRNA (adenine1518-N6/adenine1519-N6)-dimethyltransferase